MTDILVNGPDDIWVDRGGDVDTCRRRDSPEKRISTPRSSESLRRSGCRVDRSSPMVERPLASTGAGSTS